MKQFLLLVKDTFNAWRDKKATRLAAALAFYTVFSVAPLLIVVIAIAGLAFGREAAQGEIVNQISGLVGRESAEIIQNIVENARKPSAGIVATVIGLATLLLGAAGVFGQLQDALNSIWDVRPSPRRGIFRLLRDRSASFAMVAGTGFLLLVSLIVSAGVAALGTRMGNWLPIPPFALEGVNFVVTLFVTTVLFAMIYQVLPETPVSWRDVWVGALMTSVCFAVGKFLIGLYLGRGSIASAYGAAGSLVVILLWVYYSAQIMLFGAAFTRQYALRRKQSAPETAVDTQTEAEDSLRPWTAPTQPAWAGFVVGSVLGFLSARQAAARSSPKAGYH
jgi:membrane protein